MAGIDFLQDLAIIMVVAGLAGWACQRIGLSSVVGFLFAGIFIGPYTPPFAFVGDLDRIQTLSQLGLVFLMFSVGMGLSIRRLRRMGIALVIATALGALIVFAATRPIGFLLGWTPTQTLFLAAMLMVSSSAIINKVLQEIGATHEPASRVALGVTVLEDTVAVVMLTVLTSVSQVAEAGADTAPIAQTLGLILVFVILLVIVGLLVVPRLLGQWARTADIDLQTILVVGLVLTVSLLAVKAGYSIALGAFLLGAIVAETAQRAQIEQYLQGVRDVFTAVFFVSIGMLMDVNIVAKSWPIVLLISVFTVVARVFACTTSLIVIGNSTKDAVRSGVMLTPIGEFSFIIAQLGVTTKAAPDIIYPVAVGVALFTALTAPVLIKNSAAISRSIERAEPAFLKEIIGLYHGALEKLQQRQEGNVLWQLSKKRLTQVLLGFLFVTGMLAFSQPIYSAVFSRLGPDFQFQNLWRIGFWSTLGVIVLVPLVAIWRNLSTLSLMFAEVVTKGSSGGGVLRGAIEAGLRTFFAVAIAIWLWLLLPIDLAGIWTAAVIVALLAFLLVLVRHKLIVLHSKVEVQLEEMLSDAEERPVRSKQELLQAYSDWNIHLHETVLPKNTEHAGKTLTELRLRQQFGCSIAGLERHGFPIPNPTPDLALYPGDKLLILGTPNQFQKARDFLGQAKRADEKTYLLEEIEMEGVIVPAGSPAAGKLLVELEIPAATGVQLVGIEREGNRLLNPGPFQGIDVGDRLLALGTPEQITRFERWLRSVQQVDGSDSGAA